MYCFLIEINFKINSILNIGWISSSYFNKKYVTSSSSKPYGMFAYRLTTSKVAVVVFLPHLFRKSTLSLLNLFLRVLRKLLIKCQNIKFSSWTFRSFRSSFYGSFFQAMWFLDVYDIRVLFFNSTSYKLGLIYLRESEKIACVVINLI